MYRVNIAVGVAVAAAACSSPHDTSLGTTQSPTHGLACSTRGEERGTCKCFDDDRWLCAGQNSVTCRSLYGTGGGRLLVDGTRDGEMAWSECSDRRTYGVLCDGLRCTCSVNAAPTGRTFFTPRLAELKEANISCGWSLRMEGNFASLPHQGYPCSVQGERDMQTGCECRERGWDCPTASGCRMAALWQPSGKPGIFTIDADGTSFGSDSPGATWERVASGDVPGFIGTWQLVGSTLNVRSSIGPDDPTCDRIVGQHAVTFDAACARLSLAAMSDACEPRLRFLSGLTADR
jgi:hypothetical protein